MSAKERYNAIIDDIEYMATKEHLSKIEIANRIQYKNQDIPEFPAIFLFLTGCPLNNYIVSRKAQAAYKYIITAPDYNRRILDKAIEISGREDDSSLSKLFKAQFGVPPKEAQKMKDTSKIQPPKYWDDLSQENSRLEKEELTKSTPQTIYGIEKPLYDRITSINNLKAFYGFDIMHCTIAVDVADTFCFDLSDAFDYINTIKEGLESMVDDTYSATAITEDRLWRIAKDPEINYCIACNLSLPSALKAISNLHELGYESVTQCHPMLLRVLVDTSIHPFFFQEACNYYKGHTDDSYTEEDFAFFIDRISMDTPIEMAFEEMQEEKQWNEDDIFDIDPMDLDAKADEDALAFENWAQQECDYRLDPYFDPNNPKDQ